MGNYYLYRVSIFFTRLLPLSISYCLAQLLADLQYLLSKNDREAVRENLKVILQIDKVPSYMVRDVFRSFGKYLTDFFTMTQRVNKDFIDKQIDIDGLKYLEEVALAGKGGIIISAHLGNWEMGGAVLSTLGYPLSVVALSHKDERVNDLFNCQREYFGATVIQTNVSLRRCIEHLKLNRFIAILADRDFGHHGLSMTFLGQQAIIPKGAALFALRTGAPIIPAFFIRTRENRFHITFNEPIYPPKVELRLVNDSEITKLVNKYLYLIEAQIKANPTQWLIFRRFNTV